MRSARRCTAPAEMPLVVCERSSVHESGHARLAVNLGLDVLSVWGTNERRTGACVVAELTVRNADGLDRFAVATWGGYAAERIILGLNRSMRGSQDEEQLFDLAEEAEPFDIRRQREFLDRTQATAVKLVDRYRGQINKLADWLARIGELHGDDVRRLIGC